MHIHTADPKAIVEQIFKHITERLERQEKIDCMNEVEDFQKSSRKTAFVKAQENSSREPSPDARVSPKQSNSILSLHSSKTNVGGGGSRPSTPSTSSRGEGNEYPRWNQGQRYPGRGRDGRGKGKGYGGSNYPSNSYPRGNWNQNESPTQTTMVPNPLPYIVQIPQHQSSPSMGFVQSQPVTYAQAQYTSPGYFQVQAPPSRQMGLPSNNAQVGPQAVIQTPIQPKEFLSTPSQPTFGIKF